MDETTPSSANPSPDPSRAAEGSRDLTRDATWAGHIERIARGDAQALADLYDASNALIFSIASRILGNSEDAEEITLDVYTYVWRSAVQYDASRGTVATWLIMVARSRAIDRFRTTQRGDGDRVNGLSGDLLSMPLASSQDDGSNGLFVRNGLQQLDCEDRKLLELVFYSGLSHSELAATLNVPLGTVKSRVRAALGRIRNVMGKS